MQEFIIILGVISLLDAISEEVVMFCLNTHRGYKKTIKKIINRKPFNCEKCLGFWLGIILAITLNQLIFLSLPLIIRIKNRLI